MCPRNLIRGTLVSRSYKRAQGVIYLSLVLISCVAVSYCEAGFTPLEIFEEKSETPSIKSWFNGFDKYREELAKNHGTEFAFLLNHTQQIIAKSNHDQGRSRGVGYLNLEIEQRLWPGSTVFMELETDRGVGIDKFIPTYSWFNSNSGTDVDIYIPAFYLEQNLFADKISIEAGKLDLSNWFDGSAVAGSADTQFLSDALVDNLTLPFPLKGLGAMINFKPYEWFYLQSGASTAKASSTKTGLSDGFNSSFFISELGLSPKFLQLQGNYRFIFNMNHEKLQRIDEEGEEDHDFGFGVSFDQEVTK